MKEKNKNNVKVAYQKYKVCKIVNSSNKEENYKVFAESISEIKEWVLEKYNKNNLPKVEYVYSVSDIEKAKKIAKQI